MFDYETIEYEVENGSYEFTIKCDYCQKPLGWFWDAESASGICPECYHLIKYKMYKSKKEKGGD